MKNTSILYAVSLLIIAIAMVASCQKEIDFPGASRKFISGWTYKHSGATYSGCITGATYQIINGVKLLSISGNDGVNTFISILLPAPDGRLAAGTTYSAAQGAALSVDDKNGFTYNSSASASSFSFNLNAITDTSIIGTFIANLTGPGNADYVISSGSVTALIDRNNTCIPTGGNSGTSGYSLISSGSDCSDVVVEGNYKTGAALSSLNKVTITVNVSRTGTWSLTTATVNGMKFSGSGTFTTTGLQTVLLTGRGTPIQAVNTAFALVGATSNCAFYIPVVN